MFHLAVSKILVKYSRIETRTNKFFDSRKFGGQRHEAGEDTMIHRLQREPMKTIVIDSSSIRRALD